MLKEQYEGDDDHNTKKYQRYDQWELLARAAHAASAHASAVLRLLAIVLLAWVVASCSAAWMALAQLVPLKNCVLGLAQGMQLPVTPEQASLHRTNEDGMHIKMPRAML